MTPDPSNSATAANAPGVGRGAPRPVSVRLSAGLTRRWVAVWALLLGGLAIGGRGFAYIGLPPLFISELTLLAGVVVLLLQPRWRELLKQPTVLLILALLGWCAARTLPYLGQYKIDAIRDAVLVGYAVVALMVAAVVMSRPQVLPWLIARYQTFAKVFLVVMPFLWLFNKAVGESIPTWPWADVPIVDLKPGDMPVHLGAIAALSVLGLFRGRSLGWTALVCVLLGVSGAESRGGLVAFTLAFSVAFLLRPKSKWATRLVLIMAAVVSLAALSDVRVQIPGREREYSVRQLVANVVSIVDSSETSGDLDDTVEWRVQWWKKIIGYTFAGEYFWTGKGFGVNLANDDGFQVNLEDESLRSPHNGHLNVLARAGVPGFVLWCMILFAWVYVVFNAYLLARRRRESAWSMWFALLLAYWSALAFNASVDVYLEGPMGGVWFWSVMGLGIGSAWVFERHPEVLHAEHCQPREATP